MNDFDYTNDEDEGRFLLFPNADDEEYEEELMDMISD